MESITKEEVIKMLDKMVAHLDTFIGNGLKDDIRKLSHIRTYITKDD